MSANRVRGQIIGRVSGYLVAGGTPRFVGVGVASVTGSAGDYTLTFANECKLPVADTYWDCTNRGPGRALPPEIVSFSTTTIRVKTYDNTGAAVDKDFSLTSHELTPEAE